MTGLILAMLWRRRAQAVVLALLAMLAVTAAVAAPAYLRAANRAVAAGQVATATNGERSISLLKSEDDRKSASGGGDNLSFADVGPALLTFPGFTNVYAAEYPTIGIDPETAYRTRFVYRQDVCAHLSMVTGRCAVSAGDVVVGEQTAKRLKLAAGDTITLQFATFNPDPAVPIFLPDGAEQDLTVAGTYTVPRPEDPYWGTHGYFARDPGDRPGEPVFTTFATMDGMEHGATGKSVDSTANPGALDVDKLDGVRAAVAGLKDTTGKLGAAVNIRTGLPDLLARIDSGRAAARIIVPVIAVPLVMLACFVIFLAAGRGAEARRPELAVAALRGVRWWERWLLVTGENLLAIVAGAILGCLTGQLLVNAMAGVLFPGVGAAAGFASLLYAPLAAIAAILAALLAQRRELFAHVATLLRRSPGAGRRPPLLEIAVVLLAVITGIQLAVSGEPVGAGLLAPALIVFAVALVVARLLLPGVAAYSARALRRGRLGPALAGLRLSRRPGAAALFALVTAGVAVAAYAVCAVDSGEQDRAVAAGLGTGADRVISVDVETPGQLLAAARTIDPDGKFAMAVTRTPGTGDGEPQGLAVDATRLATVATWPDGGAPAGEIAAALHPQAPEPVIIKGQDVNIETTVTEVREAVPLSLTLAVTSITGGGSVQISLGTMRNGVSSYAQRAGRCAQGCRVDGIKVSTVDGSSGVTGHIVVNRLGAINPVVDAVTPSRLSDTSTWRMARFGTLSSDPKGLAIDVDAPNGLGDTGAWIQPVDTPLPLPVAGRPGNAYTGLDGKLTEVRRVPGLATVPGLGTGGTLTDLEYADRAATQSGPAANPQIWLSAAAPADVIERLAAQGVVATEDVRAASVRERLDRQGPALALWFYALAGILAVLLVGGALLLAAAVDREQRDEDLAALRAQGLGRASAGQAALWAYPLLVVLAVLTGTGTGLAGYATTGWTLPLAGLDPPPLPLPLWPRWWVVVLAMLAVLVFLVVMSVLTTSRRGRR
ncbi:FtsX-like permease family protein [Actinoplanes sp. TFC3]|uniref:FtsX-like permease family protein n=1 Tax=Actinoplanes sp. TFC3 TaxID=1710355 RepID=UPI000835713B|nr:FtsX-like permease family protein [Actinoplanes sp. TFC3]